MRLSLDLLPGQIRDPKLGDVLLNILSTHGLLPERLELEIAENIIVTDLDSAKSASPTETGNINPSFESEYRWH